MIKQDCDQITKISCLHSGSFSQSVSQLSHWRETVDSAKAAVSRDGRAGQHKIGISSSISRNLPKELCAAYYCISDPHICFKVHTFKIMLVIQIKVELWPLIKNSSLLFPYVLPKLGTYIMYGMGHLLTYLCNYAAHSSFGRLREN